MNITQTGFIIILFIFSSNFKKKIKIKIFPGSLKLSWALTTMPSVPHAISPNSSPRNLSTGNKVNFSDIYYSMVILAKPRNKMNTIGRQ